MGDEGKCVCVRVTLSCCSGVMKEDAKVQPALNQQYVTTLDVDTVAAFLGQ